MRQRLLENVTLELEEVFNQACTLEAAARNAESYIPTYQLSAVEKGAFCQREKGAFC